MNATNRDMLIFLATFLVYICGSHSMFIGYLLLVGTGFIVHRVYYHREYTQYYRDKYSFPPYN